MKNKIKKLLTIMAAGVMLLISVVPASAQEMQNFRHSQSLVIMHPM